jgi:hypothetical protein
MLTFVNWVNQQCVEHSIEQLIFGPDAWLPFRLMERIGTLMAFERPMRWEYAPEGTDPVLPGTDAGTTAFVGFSGTAAAVSDRPDIRCFDAFLVRSASGSQQSSAACFVADDVDPPLLDALSELLRTMWHEPASGTDLASASPVHEAAVDFAVDHAARLGPSVLAEPVDPVDVLRVLASCEGSLLPDVDALDATVNGLRTTSPSGAPG